MVFSVDWDAAFNVYPSENVNKNETDDIFRALKAAIQERIDVDHYMDMAGTQTYHGEHRKITFQAVITTPTNVTGKGFVYIKEVNGSPELHWQGEAGGEELQLTVGGRSTGIAEKLELSPIATPTPAADTGFVYAKDVDSQAELHWLNEGGDEIQITSGDMMIPRFSRLLHVEDQKPSKTAGGAFSANGVFDTRDLTVTRTNEIPGAVVDLGLNQISLLPGTYFADISVPASKIFSHRARLHDVTNDTTLIWGSSEGVDDGNTGDAISNRSVITRKFIITSDPTTIEVQHACTDYTDPPTVYAFGKGHPASTATYDLGPEIYTIVKIWY